MSNWSYVFNCLFATKDCDECGMDCWLCPYYDENEDDDAAWIDEEDEWIDEE